MTMKQIQIDLQEIRYYYAHKDMFDKACNFVVKNTIIEKVGKYNEVTHDAPPRLYALYVALYTENNTQIVVADDWGVSEGYIKNLNRKLRDYLLAVFNKNHKESDSDDNV